YRPITVPGVWVATTLPGSYDAANATPWVMTRSHQFRPGPPPALDSDQWIRDYNEIKSVGARNSTVRTSQQTDIGRFWSVVGPPSWNPPARQLAIAKKLDLVDKARLLALVHMAGADAYIAVFDAKYAFNFWRPLTAVRNGGGDAIRQADPTWMPLID